MESLPPPQPERKPVRRLTWLLLVLLAALGLFTGTLRLPQARPDQARPAPHRPAMPLPPAPVRANGEMAEVYRDARSAVVRIESRCANRLFGGTPIDVGTGFFVSPEGRLVTAYHVVRRQTLPRRSSCSLEYLAVDSQRREYPLELIGFDAFRDLAMMQAVIGEPVDHLRLSRAPPRVGSEVVAIGNSRGEFLADRSGSVTRLGVRAGKADFASGTIELTAALAPGDSGGPVVASDGTALGVVSYISFEPAVLSVEGEPLLGRFFGGSEAPEFASYAVPLLDGSEVMRALHAGERQDIPVIGFEFAFDYDPRAPGGPSLGRRPGVVVGRVQADGPGAAAGLRSLRERMLVDEQGRAAGSRLSGDVIVAVDGRPTPTFERLLQVVREKSVGQRVVLTVQRGSASIELPLELAPYRVVFR